MKMGEEVVGHVDDEVVEGKQKVVGVKMESGEVVEGAKSLGGMDMIGYQRKFASSGYAVSRVWLRDRSRLRTDPATKKFSEPEFSLQHAIITSKRREINAVVTLKSTEGPEKL